MKSRLLIVVGLSLIVILMGVGYLIYNSPGNRFVRTYHQLKLGMGEDDVRKLFGKPPDLSCRYRTSRICYFLAPNSLTRSPDRLDDVELQPGATVSSPEGLPNIYAAAQLAFDANGRLYAFTWNGETYTIETSHGSVRGSHFAELDDSYFQ